MNCRACGHHTTEVMNFGDVALAGAFLKPEEFAAEKRYPLTLQFCEKCLLVQVGAEVPAATMFEKYFYFSSATETMRRHYEKYARDLVRRFSPESVLEIGCNDGVLLRPLKDIGIKRLLGVDPAENVTPRDLPIVNAYWGERFAQTMRERFDLVLANNVFAHIADINGACAAVAKVLSDKGSFVFEVNRLDSLVAGLQYDWIYHEHLYYYSLLALDHLLARHGLEIYDLDILPTHAGSVRYYAARRGVHSMNRSVVAQRERELWLGVQHLWKFEAFAKDAKAHREQLGDIVRSTPKAAGYGACGRTNTMLQWCGLTARDIAYIVDDAPAKQGYFTPGTHIPVCNIARLADDPPECLVVFAWSFLDEIKPKLSKFTGRVYVPLPNHIYEHKERRAA